MSKISVIRLDRSRLETLQSCPRKFYWNYVYGGLGVERKAMGVPLLTGSLIHEPLAMVLGWAREHGVVPGREAVNVFVRDAQQGYLKVVEERGLLLDSFDGAEEGKLGSVERNPFAWQVNEQLALVEALVKGWVEVRLPSLLAEYEIVDVEQEQDFDLGNGTKFMTRRDALLRRRNTGEYFVLNFKTTSNPDATWREQWRYDTQTLSEFVAADESLREAQRVASLKNSSSSKSRGFQPEGLSLQSGAVEVLSPVMGDGAKEVVGVAETTNEVHSTSSASPEACVASGGGHSTAVIYSGPAVRGVIIEGLVKGQRKVEWPEDSGQWRHNSPLLYHYEEPGAAPFPASYKASAYYTCKEGHPHRWTKGGSCPGGKKHKIGDSFRRNMVTQSCGFDAWLEWMKENEPELLASQFISLPPILRSEWEIDEWKRTTTQQGSDIRVNVGSLGGSTDALPEFFPKATGHGNCLRPSRCPYLDLCFGVGDPDDREQFLPRVPNHPQELANKGGG